MTHELIIITAIYPQIKMQKALIIILVLAIATVTLAQSHEEAEDASHLRVRRGFGCPFNQYECHSHCASIRGYKGGYCDEFLKMRCKCY
ncbi:defensin BmKDfsin3-like [Ornithodoros turicata]|uniref:defensin BmKDfsin3-like n=1 Tax=Ornithodoros turicata TaxID=34597 RepID=UPI0031395941